jgi:hypothetical protein
MVAITKPATLQISLNLCTTLQNPKRSRIQPPESLSPSSLSPLVPQSLGPSVPPSLSPLVPPSLRLSVPSTTPSTIPAGGVKL